MDALILSCTSVSVELRGFEVFKKKNDFDAIEKKCLYMIFFPQTKAVYTPLKYFLYNFIYVMSRPPK